MSLALSCSLTLGVFSGAASAISIGNAANAETQQATISSNAYQENATVSVKYSDANRTHATVSYHKEGVAAPSYNLIFLLDISTTGKEATESFMKMMQEGGISAVTDHAASNEITIVGHRSVPEVFDSIHSKYGFYDAFRRIKNISEGNGNEVGGLKEVISRVKNSSTSRPTAVIWVQGDIMTSPRDKVEEQLKELKGALGKEDALVTWQLGKDTPDELLKKYASTYTDPHSGDSMVAAFANSNAAQFRTDMRDSLESIVHEHYHNISFKLALADNANMVKEVTSARLIPDKGSAQMTAVPSADHRSMDITLDWLCQQIGYTMEFELELEPEVFGTQTVVEAGDVIVPADHSNGGLHTGIFDDTLVGDMVLHYPEAVIDRAKKTLDIDLNGGVGSRPADPYGLADTYITLPDLPGVTRPGKDSKGEPVTEYFSAWRLDNGTSTYVYQPVSIVRMPENGGKLTALYGHLEVELEVKETEQRTSGNQICDVKLGNVIKELLEQNGLF